MQELEHTGITVVPNQGVMEGHCLLKGVEHVCVQSSTSVDFFYEVNHWQIWSAILRPWSLVAGPKNSHSPVSQLANRVVG